MSRKISPLFLMLTCRETYWNFLCTNHSCKLSQISFQLSWFPCIAEMKWINTCLMTEKLVSKLVERYCWKHSGGADSKLSWDTSYPEWIFCDFPHFHQTVAGIVSQLCHDWFLPNPYEFIIHQPYCLRHWQHYKINDKEEERRV